MICDELIDLHEECNPPLIGRCDRRSACLILRTRMEESKLDVQTLAKYLGVGRATIYAWLRGESRIPYMVFLALAWRQFIVKYGEELKKEI